MRDIFEQLLDANIAVLSKTVQMSKRGKNLKAEFVRDDGAGGKYYGYLRGGKVHVIHDRMARGRGKWGSATPYEQQLGAESESGSMDVPDSAPDKAVDFGGQKVQQWRQDAENILGTPSEQGAAERPGQPGVSEVGAVQSEGGGSYAPSQQDTSGGGGRNISKPQTNLENTLARLAEAEMQFLRVKRGMSDAQAAYKVGIKTAKGMFNKLVLQTIKKMTGQDIIYDIGINQFRYAHEAKELNPRDRAVVDRIVQAFIVKADKQIKARTTAVRRAEGSDE